MKTVIFQAAIALTLSGLTEAGPCPCDIGNGQAVQKREAELSAVDAESLGLEPESSLGDLTEKTGDDEGSETISKRQDMESIEADAFDLAALQKRGVAADEPDEEREQDGDVVLEKRAFTWVKNMQNWWNGVVDKMKVQES